MKLLKIFKTKKASSSLDHNSSVTSSSSSTASDSIVEESQDVSPGNERNVNDSSVTVRKNPKSTEMASTSTSYEDDVSRVSPPAGDQVFKELEDAFKMFDRNGDGKISSVELCDVLRSLGDEISDEDLHLMFEAADADGDGYIDLQEFIDLNQVAGDGAGTASRSEELRAAFHVFDIDNNDYISAEELHQVLIRLGQPSLTIEECCRMIDGVDSNGDGLVDFAEFERMMTDSWVF